MKSNILQFRYLCDGKIRHAGWPLSVKRKFIWIRTFCFFLFVCFVIIICLGSGDIQWLVCHCHKSYFFLSCWWHTLSRCPPSVDTDCVCVCRCRSVAWHTTFVHRVRKPHLRKCKMLSVLGFGRMRASPMACLCECLSVWHKQFWILISSGFALFRSIGVEC